MKEFLETDTFNYIIKPFIYIAVAYILYKIITLVINMALRPKKMGRRRISNHQAKRIETTRSVMNNILKYIIIVITFLLILSIYNVNVSSIFAGLGIATAVLSLAFQDVAKDFLAGLSILLEDQFEVGDNIEVNGFRGTVIALGLKTTQIQHLDGSVKIMANHTINEIVNYSMKPSLAIVDISVSYESDLNKVEKVLEKTMKKIDETYKDLKGKCELWGVEALSESSVVYRIVVLTKPLENFMVQRQMRKDFKLALDKAGIKIPYQQIEVHNEQGV